MTRPTGSLWQRARAWPGAGWGARGLLVGLGFIGIVTAIHIDDWAAASLIALAFAGVLPVLRPGFPYREGISAIALLLGAVLPWLLAVASGHPISAPITFAIAAVAGTAVVVINGIAWSRDQSRPTDPATDTHPPRAALGVVGDNR